MRQVACTVLAFLLFSSLVVAQKAQPGLLNAEDLKHAVPSGYFFNGQSAPVELRNSAGFRTADGKMVLAGLVDTSGYAADIQQKYEGFFITESKINVGGSNLDPGAYGFGFTKDGKFLRDECCRSRTPEYGKCLRRQTGAPGPAQDDAGWRRLPSLSWQELCCAEGSIRRASVVKVAGVPEPLGSRPACESRSAGPERRFRKSYRYPKYRPTPRHR